MNVAQTWWSASTLRPTKAVKGQNGKRLVTAGTIKRPLPCPEKRTEKHRIHGVRKKSRVKKEKKKDKKENREEKRGN